MSNLEARIRLEVGRVITNVSNWPSPVDIHMLGHDLSGPIDKITAALLPVIAASKVEALREAAGELTEVIENVQSGNRPNGVEWQTGALAMRDWLRATS